MASQDPQQAFHWRYSELDDASFQVRGRTLFGVAIVFSVILLAALFFFYARWVCTLSSSSLIDNPNHLSSPATCGDVEAIRSIPVIVVVGESSEVGGGGECCICLGAFEDGDKLKMLPGCRHCFHAHCIDRWLSSQSNCPLCRSSLLPTATG